MAFLIIAGVTLKVQSTGAREAAPVVTGASVRMFDGSLRTTKRTPKYVGSFVAGPMSESDYQTLRTAIPVGTFVTCSGDALPSSMTAEVEMSSAEYVRDGLGFKRTVALTVTEV